MLNKEEKKEILADGHSLSRRIRFAKIKGKRTEYSLDDFLCFLKGFQKIFSSLASPTKRPITKYNKL